MESELQEAMQRKIKAEECDDSLSAAFQLHVVNICPSNGFIWLSVMFHFLPSFSLCFARVFTLSRSLLVSLADVRRLSGPEVILAQI